jgi:inorganic pyrophosphatase
MVYKQLQGHEVKNEGWVGAEEAKTVIKRSMVMYRDKFPPRGERV